MTDVLALAAIVPASAGACCTVGAWRPGRAVDVVAAVAMVVAMLDGVLWPRVVPGVVWFVVLAMLAVALAAVGRLQREPAGRHDPTRAVGPRGAVTRAGHAVSGRLHAALGLLVMGAMGIGAGHTGGMAGMAGMAGAHAHGGPVGATWQVVLAGLVVGHAVLTGLGVRDGIRTRAPLASRIETVTMGFAVVVMAVGMSV